jgi:CheY-like chemotaxis protein
MPDLQTSPLTGQTILVLDDDGGRHKVFARALIGNVVMHVRTAKEAIRAFAMTQFAAAFLDHDLGGQQMVPSGPGTGYEVAEWLAAHPDNCPRVVYVHSHNPVGVANMRRALPGVIALPFDPVWGR